MAFGVPAPYWKPRETITFRGQLLWRDHSARIAKIMLTHLISRFSNLFASREVPWYEATDENVPR